MSSVKRDITSIENHSRHSDVCRSSVTGVVGKIGGRNGGHKSHPASTNSGISEIENIKISLQRTSNIEEIAHKNSLSLTFVEGDTIYRTDYTSGRAAKVVVGSVRKRVAVKSRVIKLK